MVSFFNHCVRYAFGVRWCLKFHTLRMPTDLARNEEDRVPHSFTFRTRSSILANYSVTLCFCNPSLNLVTEFLDYTRFLPMVWWCLMVDSALTLRGGHLRPSTWYGAEWTPSPSLQQVAQRYFLLSETSPVRWRSATVAIIGLPGRREGG